MTIRPYRPSDREAVIALHRRHGENFYFADPDDPINVSTLVAEIDGAIVAVLTGRMVVESFLIVDPEVAPIPRWRIMRALFDGGLALARTLGFREAISSVPTHLGKYADLLARLPGFMRDTRARFIVNVYDRRGRE